MSHPTHRSVPNRSISSEACQPPQLIEFLESRVLLSGALALPELNGFFAGREAGLSLSASGLHRHLSETARFQFSTSDSPGTLAGQFLDGQALWSFTGTLQNSRFVLNLQASDGSTGSITGQVVGRGNRILGRISETVGGTVFRGNVRANRSLNNIFGVPFSGRAVGRSYVGAGQSIRSSTLVTLTLTSEQIDGSITGMFDGPIGPLAATGTLSGNRLDLTLFDQPSAEYAGSFLRGFFSNAGTKLTGNLQAITLGEGFGGSFAIRMHS